MSDVENIENVYKRFTEIVEKLANPGITNFVEATGEDLIMSPANAQEDEYGCCSAGLIEFGLLLSQHMRKLNLVSDFQIDTKSIYTVAFLRAFGEYGTSEVKMFQPHDSDWHIEKLGLLYKRNPKLNGTNWVQRSVELSFSFGIKLTSEQIMALQTAVNDTPANNLGKLLKSATLLIL